HSMPLTRRSVERSVASAWFTGLLPEGYELRRAMAEAHGEQDTSSMALLKSSGLDCAGAVQITPEMALPTRKIALESISEQEIGARLIAVTRGEPAATKNERWSVAGQQGKIALHRGPAGSWARAVGGMPTTHIIKPGIVFAGREPVEDQALTEHMTLATAEALGVPAARSEFHEFDGVPAVVVERYDRLALSGQVLRIHQEDLCQALGVAPEMKYEEQGGPDVAHMAAFLDRIAMGPEQSREFRASFAMMVIYNYLTGCPDAHAKNYSVLILPDKSVSFAPMYDAATGFGYSLDGTDRLRFARAAMKIGFHDRFFSVVQADWEKFARDLNLPFAAIIEERDRLAESIPDTMRMVLQRDAPTSARNRILAGPLFGRLERSCVGAQ
ncbi:MAG: HipA domain-containing protein, partial [Ancrocorticia sp.]